MDETDRTAIHEVMEQQTISIAKAGITTTLNARAAVLAAANPLYGRYNTFKSISENVDLPNSLLSRFDLLFLILDRADMEKDHALAQHVQHVHKFMKNPKQAVTPVPPEAFKQYIAAAKAFNPRVPKELGTYVIEAYVSMRQQDNGSGSGGRGSGSGAKFKPYNSTSTGYGGNSGATDQAVMTARQLLSILRLSQALARIRLSNTVSHDDIDEAIRLTHASKASLTDDSANNGGGPGGNGEDVTSSIYNIMRDFAVSRNNTVNFIQIEAMVLKKGFTSAQLKYCLSEYELLGVISVDRDGSTIHFQE
jgi:DNA replication licensing factor MCM7